MQPALVADLNGVALDDQIEALPEVVAAGREDAMRLRRMFRSFCSPSPVQKYSAPSSQTATSGVTCGRPSARTVESADIRKWHRQSGRRCKQRPLRELKATTSPLLEHHPGTELLERFRTRRNFF